MEVLQCPQSMSKNRSANVSSVTLQHLAQMRELTFGKCGVFLADMAKHLIARS